MKDKGFSLLEVIIGAFIVTSVFSGVAALWMLHQRVMHQSRNRLIANFVLQSEMERVLAGGFYTVDDRAAEPPQVYTIVRTFRGTTQQVDFTTDIDFDTTPDLAVRKVWATVSFEEQNRGVQTITMESDVFWSQ